MSQSTAILIVDDNKQIRTLLRLQLQRFNCQCDEASNGAEALELATESHYRLILMDIGMPVMDGFTCIAKLRAHQEPMNRRSKVYAITGQSHAEECRAKGFDGFLQKPVVLADIEKILKSHLLHATATV